MKLSLSLGLYLLCISTPAQERPDLRMHVACMAAPTHLGKCWTDERRPWVPLAIDEPSIEFVRHASIGEASPGGSSSVVSVTLSAATIRYSTDAVPIWILHGNAEIRTADLILNSDDVRFNRATGEIEASGMVHLRLATPR
jgi:hypothetical protein